MKGRAGQPAETGVCNPPRLAEVRIVAPISIIIPTYREAQNIPFVIERIRALREARDLDLELIFVDDQSNDGSVEAVAAAGLDWVRIIVRDGPRGLSLAVVEGFRAARNEVLVCMDGDLSHPPETIPDLILMLDNGHDLAIGSRYVRGGSTDDDWGFFRWLNSQMATLLARPLTRVSDPMSGFFAVRKSDFDQARDLNPIGYKIALEIIVKCDLENIGEVPIHFVDRARGESKLTFKEQLRYIQHVRRLYLYRFANAMYLLQFLVVGASGMVVNLATLSALQFIGMADWVALMGGIGISVVSNFLLNRRFTFSYARRRNPWTQFRGFLVASLVGILVNYVVAIQLSRLDWFQGPFGLQLAAMTGIACGLVFNFLGNRFAVFRRQHLRGDSRR